MDWIRIAEDLGVTADSAEHLERVIESRWVEASAAMLRDEADRLSRALARLQDAPRSFPELDRICLRAVRQLGRPAWLA